LQKQVAIVRADPWRAEVRDAATGAIQHSIPMSGRGPIAFAGPGVLAIVRENDVVGMDVATRQVKWTLPVPDEVIAMQASEDGKLLAIQLSNAKRRTAAEGETRTVRSTDAKQLCAFKGSYLPFALAPDGHALSLEDHGDTTIYDAQSCRVLLRGERCQAGSVLADRWITDAIEKGGGRRWMVTFAVPQGQIAGTLEMSITPRIWHMDGGRLAIAFETRDGRSGTQLASQPADALAGPLPNSARPGTDLVQVSCRLAR
jgi:hypothetical protein